jgi:hypothetical protein
MRILGFRFGPLTFYVNSIISRERLMFQEEEAFFYCKVRMEEIKKKKRQQKS